MGKGAKANNYLILADNLTTMLEEKPIKEIDPRQPRFSAGITSIVALLALVSFLAKYDLVSVLLYLYATFIFIWAVFFPSAWHPYLRLYKIISKRLDPPAYMEDSRAPAFAQKIGLLVSVLAFIFSLFIPIVGAIFGLMLFIASAANAYFNVCIGCILYLRLRKLGIKI